ncbi:MAG: 16S rRNA (uracil(1498)-N(3))-methyltransferase [Myxococcota bacterium]|jgi:RsmE family RNA methyltransferase|nr:16S rRNA (uracil(1498)-N(3))-methyltransferase [Myxococcota bacterium]
MNLILLFESDFSTPLDATGCGRVSLSGRRAAYVQSIHRAGPGDELQVGVLNGRIGRGEILAVEDDRVDLTVRLERDPPAALPLNLVLALPRPLVLKRVLIAATSLGCKRIFLIQSRRVERSFWNSKVLRNGQLDEPLILGLEQAVDTVMPSVELRTRFKPFVEDELPGLIGEGQAFVAHPGAQRPCPRDLASQTTLVIGPEGGFIPYEFERLDQAGCTGIALGERILRIETALPVLLAKMF